MSDGLRLQCPYCSTVLKVKTRTDLDPSRRIKCPKCAQPFSIAEGSAEPPSASAAAPQPGPAKKKKTPATSADSWEQQDDVFGGVSSEGAAYEDDWANSGEDQSDDDPWSGRGSLKSGTSRQSSGASSKRTTASRSPDPPALRNLGVIGWFLFGGLGMMLGIGLSTVLGLTDMGLLIGLGPLIVGPIVGFGIRFGAGPYSSGVGPGLFAAFLAFVAIICGKFGAFSVSSSGSETENGEAPNAEVAAEEQNSFMEELESEHLSEPALIARIANKIQTEWIMAGKLTEEQIDAHFEENEAEYDPSLNYLPEVWQEAGNRWNGMAPDVRAATVRQVQQEYYGEEMSPDMEPISEDQVKEWIASSVTDEWLESGRITPEQIEAHHAEQMDSIATAGYKAVYTPEVWQEANNRWAAMSPEQKEASKQEVRVEMKQLEEFGETVRAAVGWAKVIGLTILSCFWPLYNPVFLVGSVISAYKIGAHSESKLPARAAGGVGEAGGGQR